MKRLFLLAALMAAFILPGAANAQLNNLFGNPSAPASAAAEAGSMDIARMLTDGGFTLESQGADGCSTNIEMNGVTYPVSVTPTQNNQMIWIRVGLIEVPDSPGSHAEKILRLLELSGTYGHAFYSYNSQTRLLELYAPLDATLADAAELKNRIDAMIAQADEQYDAWNTEDWTSERHVGSWSATPGPGESMVINLRGDGSFDLTNRTNTGVMSISGRYRLEAGTLQMKDTSGAEISGDIQFIGGNQFNLNVNNNSMSFERS